MEGLLVMLRAVETFWEIFRICKTPGFLQHSWRLSIGDSYRRAPATHRLRCACPGAATGAPGSWRRAAPGTWPAGGGRHPGLAATRFLPPPAVLRPAVGARRP